MKTGLLWWCLEMDNGLTPQESIWLNGLKQFLERTGFKKKGWRISKSENRFRVDGDTLTIEVLDRYKHKHWLRISVSGEVVFAPTRMTCF